MTDRLVEIASEFLNDLQEGNIPADDIDECFGAFAVNIFNEKEFDVIPVFFEILGCVFVKDYSQESEYISKILQIGTDNYKDFEKDFTKFILKMLLE